MRKAVAASTADFFANFTAEDVFVLMFFHSFRYGFFIAVSSKHLASHIDKTTCVSME